MGMMKKNIFQIIYTFAALILFFTSSASYAVVIGPNTLISTPTTYTNTTVDMTNGNFIVTNNATLTIENSTVLGTISANTPTLINVALGSLVMKSNRVAITVTGVLGKPDLQAIHYVIHLAHANASLTGNTFSVDRLFTAGLLITDANTPTGVVNIADNSFQNFHGVLYLLNSPNALIKNNIFEVNSSGNLVLVGDDSAVTNNTFYFAGRNHAGNAIDIVDSEGVTVAHNVIFNSNCLGIHILASKNIIINSNNITGGVTYGITLESAPNLKGKDAKNNNFAINLLTKLGKKSLKHSVTQVVTINNNVLSQNHYGIVASDVDTLSVTDNYFSQRFLSNAARKFWTDNTNLLINVTNLNWNNNLYKEAFTQEIDGDNSLTQFVTFPVTGGVVLSGCDAKAPLLK